MNLAFSKDLPPETRQMLEANMVSKRQHIQRYPLHVAAELGLEVHLMTMLLLEAGHGNNSRGGQQLTPLHLAVGAGEEEMVKH